MYDSARYMSACRNLFMSGHRFTHACNKLGQYCRPKGEEARSHRGQDALRQLLPVLEHITLHGDSLAQREAAYAMANLTAVGTS